MHRFKARPRQTATNYSRLLSTQAESTQRPSKSAEATPRLRRALFEEARRLGRISLGARSRELVCVARTDVGRPGCSHAAVWKSRAPIRGDARRRRAPSRSDDGNNVNIDANTQIEHGEEKRTKPAATMAGPCRYAPLTRAPEMPAMFAIGRARKAAPERCRRLSCAWLALRAAKVARSTFRGPRHAVESEYDPDQAASAWTHEVFLARLTASTDLASLRTVFDAHCQKRFSLLRLTLQVARKIIFSGVT